MSETGGRGDSGGAGLALAFLAGAVLGAGLALLLAPRTGRETREQLAEWAARLREKAGQATG